MNEISISCENCSLLLQQKEDKDYSGYNFINCSIMGKDKKDYNTSFFKGCVFDNVKIHEAEFNNVEFDETVISNNSYFFNCFFDASDFIYNNIEDTIFENCTFIHGEWRESLFENVKFINCDFTNATINLCSFINCNFDEISSKSFHGKGKSFNVFYKTIFPYCEIDFLKNNFGLVGHQKLIKINDEKNIYFELSYLYFTNQLLQKKFIESILDVIKQFNSSKTQNYQAKLKYIINVINMMSRYHLSVFNSEYLYNEIYQQIKFSHNQVVVIELMKLFTSLKENIQYKELEIKNKFESYENFRKDIYTIEFIFNNTYSLEEMKNFLKALCIKLNIVEYKILNYSKGSTIFEIALTFMNGLKPILEAINYFVPTITKIINNIGEFKKSISNLQVNNIDDSKKNSHPLQIRDTTENRTIIIETKGMILEIDGDVKRIKIS